MKSAMSRARRAQLAAGTLTCGAAIVLAANSAALAHDEHEGSSSFQVESVKVLTANTVATTFSNPLDTSRVTATVFHAPHEDWDVPHTHNATSVAFSNANKTATATLDRNLHPQEPLCNTSEPRCSTDELDWVINGAVDIYGNKLSDDDWEVWNIGSER
jgi:hypothetical protein